MSVIPKSVEATAIQIGLTAAELWEELQNKSKKPWEGRSMTLNEYQEKSRKTANYHGCLSHEDGIGIPVHVNPKLESLVYCSLGLAGEAGEVVENTKKLLRDDNTQLTEQRREKIISELGDVLWYVANLANSVDAKLEDVAEYNLRKLEERYRK